MEHPETNRIMDVNVGLQKQKVGVLCKHCQNFNISSRNSFIEVTGKNTACVGINKSPTEINAYF